MHTYSKRFMRNFDFPLFFTFLILSLFGLVMIYSSSMLWAVHRYDLAPNYFFRKQIFNLVIAYFVFFLAAFFPYQNYRRKKVMIFLVAVMFTLLILVHFIGWGDHVGAKSWLSLGFVNIQPSEIAKLVIIVYMSGVFTKKYESGMIDNLNQSIAPPIFILTAAVGLVLLEPDFGTSLIIVLTALSVMAASGIKIKTFLKITGLIGACLVLAIPILLLNLTDSRKGRILSYLNPFEYSQGSGYQIANGYIAIGSGGVKGNGLGNSIQKMGYLPEPHTDVIMAVISEELGVLGALIVVGGLGFIVLRAFSIALKTKDPQARMLAAGIGSMIGIQAFINLGGVTGIIPLTGVTLPFISYGGTSVILLSLGIGILMNVSMYTRYEKTKN